LKREENTKNINVRNAKKHDQLNQLKHDMSGFNFDQDLIPYGLRLQEKLNNKEFLPSFHEYIYNFKSLIKCQNCYSFPKYNANGLCKVCYFFFLQQKQDKIFNKNFIITESPSKSSTSTLTSPSLLALHTIFGYLNFHEGQQEVIGSFVNNKYTLVLFPTGKGKSLCYSIGSLLINGITIVLSPLKALIEDQVMELIRSGIPSSGLYAASDKPLSYQE
jgi:superfamily II DNA helicase RecQ